MAKYYVSMTDRVMSDWGMSKGKLNKLVLECDNLEEAEVVKRNAQDRSEMEDITIHKSKPTHNTKKYYTTYHGKSDYKRWYSPDRPFKR